MANLKVLNKKILTKIEGVFYKEIVNENNKVVDKIFLIRYRENFYDKQKTIGKFSEGIRLEFCKAKRIEILNKIKHGEYVGKKFRITFHNRRDLNEALKNVYSQDRN